MFGLVIAPLLASEEAHAETNAAPVQTEMEQEVMKQHIDLYVNNYSINLGAEGRAAIEKLLEVARKGS